ncbi:protein regulator of cytokinesis 1-like [Uranotaenia lowii]|uniref:protein regulator of cytokinesis 1-like n=1 Tax=Uranotaenia lowii TaxID=190385 RepID=UPI00247A65BF|nr:protein regulator of cytokinesis 1-like [Uranotaenia lowii]
MNDSLEMDRMDEIEQTVTRQAQDIVYSSIHRVRQLWEEIFDEQIFQDHMIRLPEHIQTFFDEVYEESENRKLNILKTIEELKQEAANLKRLLREDIAGDDVEPEPGIPLRLVQIQLDQSLEVMREKLRLRHDHIDEYLLEEETLCEELGETPRLLSKDPLPSEAEMCEFRSYLDNMRAEKLQRFDEIASMRREIKIMMSQLEIVAQSERQDELINAKNFPPTRYNLTELRHLHELICSQYEDLKDNIDRIRDKLQNLWSYLAVSPSKIKRFDKYNDYTQTTYDKLFTELDRCETLRRENIQAFVDRARMEIVEWWDKCLKSNDERSRFSTFKSDVYNEDLLTLHEMELNDLKEFYRNYETIFQLIEQRREMFEKMIKLEQKSNDPSRYNNRGGKLLEEEKERKRICIQLPKIENRLLEACHSYEQENKRKFTVFGEPVDEMIQSQWSRHREGKMMTSSARKKANMATPTTSNRTALVRTPRTADATAKHTSLSSRVRLAMANDPTMKSTSVSKQLSSSKMSSSALKRKLPSPKTGAVKRSLLKDLNNSPQQGFLKPTALTSASKGRLLLASKSPGKIPTIKVYETKNGGSVAQKRRSRRKSQNRSRRSVSRAKPDIIITPSSETTVTSESVSYEHFENFFEHNTPNRSSLMPPDRKAAAAAGSRGNPRRNLRTNGTVASTQSTPSRITFRNPTASSTMLGSTMLRSPSGFLGNTTASGKKLMPNSKNCPIIF